SYSIYLDIISADAGRPLGRVLFAATATLACLSHYCALLYVTALAVVSCMVVLRRYTPNLGRRCLREAATFAPVLAIPACEFYLHFRTLKADWYHLFSFYYDPAGGESLTHFLLRASQAELNNFLPWPVQSRAAFLMVLAFIGVCAALLLFVLRAMNSPLET